MRSGMMKSVATGSLAAGAALVSVVAVVLAQPAAGAQQTAAADPAVITTWNAVAQTTITAPAPSGAGKANAEGFLWYGFVQAAVYNAVNGITGEYELYEWNVKGPKGASPQAAAAAAAHGVLMEYFGSGDFRTAARSRRTWMLHSPRRSGRSRTVSPRSRASGMANEPPSGSSSCGSTTAASPRSCSTCRRQPASGGPRRLRWLRSSPPGWDRSIRSCSSRPAVRPGPPPAIGSDLYVEEFEEVRDYGVSSGSLRTADADADGAVLLRRRAGPTAGWAPRPCEPPSAGHQRQRASLRRGRHERGRLGGRRLGRQVPLRMVAPDHRDSRGRHGRQSEHHRRARLDASPRHAALSRLAERAEWGFRRRDADALAAEPRRRRVDLNITSAAAGGITRHYEYAEDLRQDAVDSRVWSGIHFRRADEVAFEMGTQVGNWALDHYFAPAK